MRQAISTLLPHARAEFEHDVLSATARFPSRWFFALVDLAPHAGLLKKLVHADDIAKWKSLFDGTPEEALLDGAPILIELPAKLRGNALLNALISAERSSPSVSWICSSLSFEHLFLHLQAFIDIDMPDGRRVLFRFYDPRTLSAIRGGLSSDRFGKKLLSPISEWWLWQSGAYRNLLEGYRHA